MKQLALIAALACLLIAPLPTAAQASRINQAVKTDYDAYLKALFVHFHKNP